VSLVANHLCKERSALSSTPRTRWAVFTASVLSSVDNPDAYLWRTLATLLRQRGDEAIFYEPRGNAALRALLQRSGSGALKEFRSRHPDIEYRTLEPRVGAELVEWMTRTLATADVALVQSTASPLLIEWLGKLTRHHLRTFFVDSGWDHLSASETNLAEHLAGFTAIAAGSELVERRYQGIAPGMTIVTFGPLPDPSSLDDSSVRGATALRAGCERLVSLVIAERENAHHERNSRISPNGRVQET
jgi:hypothetical protein